MDFTKYIAILQNSALFFAQPLGMEDPFEGGLPTKNKLRIRDAGLRSDVPLDQIDLFVADQQRILTWGRQNVYLSCWHMNQHESAAMWKLYMKSDEGIAIRTTFGHMKNAFLETQETIHPFILKYIDYNVDDFTIGTLFDCLLHKRKSFEHETELRLAWPYLSDSHIIHGSVPIVESIPTHIGPGRNICVNLLELVQEVYVSPTSPSWARDVVEGVTRQYQLNCQVIKSDLLNPTFL